MQLYGGEDGQEWEDETLEGTDGESYDNLFGKMKIRRALKKRKKRRRARRQARNEARQAPPQRPMAPPRPVQRKPAQLEPTQLGNIASKLPLVGVEGAAHKAVNKAMQEEYKTKQEEVKTKGLEKKVEQEDLKAEKLKAQTGFAKNAQYIVWFVVIAGVGYVGYDAYMKHKGK